MKSSVFLIVNALWCGFAWCGYIFEPLFETGGRSPAVWYGGRSAVRVIQASDELLECALIPGVRGVLLVGENKDFDSVLPVPSEFSEGFSAFVLNVSTHSAIARAFTRSLHLSVLPVPCAILLVDGQVRVPFIQINAQQRNNFWQQCMLRKLSQESDEEQGWPWIADYSHKIAQYLYSLLQKAYHWITSVREPL